MNHHIIAGAKEKNYSDLTVGVYSYIETMCDNLGVKFTELLSNSRKRHIVYSRSVIYFRLKEFGLGVTQIGRIFNREHSIVCYGVSLSESLAEDAVYQSYLKRSICKGEKIHNVKNIHPYIRDPKGYVSTLKNPYIDRPTHKL